MTYRGEYELVEPARAELDAAPGLVLLEFGAPWCGHCRAAQPALQELLQDHQDIRHLKIEDGRGKPLGRGFRIKLWPTLVLLRAGEELARVVRPVSADDLAPLAGAMAAR